MVLRKGYAERIVVRSSIVALTDGSQNKVTTPTSPRVCDSLLTVDDSGKLRGIDLTV